MTSTPSSNVGADASRGHTPGPWFAHGPAGKGRQWGVTTSEHFDPSRGAKRRICLMGSPRSYECEQIDSEDEANARLVAAAPELLEALEDSLPELVALLTHLDEAPELEAKIAKARAAIAKARPTHPAGETK